MAPDHSGVEIWAHNAGVKEGQNKERERERERERSWMRKRERLNLKWEIDLREY
jgi:hypothetical protein